MNDSLTQSPDWLDLRAIESMTQIPYSTLRPYAALEILQQALGAEERPGSRGVRWPASSVSTWQQLAEAIRRKTVQPGTVKAWLKERGFSTETALVPLSQSPATQSLNESLSHYGEDALSLLSAILETLNRQPPPLPDYPDILTAQQAADYLQCSVRALRKQVPASFRIGKSARGDRWVKAYLIVIPKNAADAVPTLCIS